MGAWIETSVLRDFYSVGGVAPHVGAWIETHFCLLIGAERQVAPHVGAWIETKSPIIFNCCVMSLPMWERGLKHGLDK